MKTKIIATFRVHEQFVDVIVNCLIPVLPCQQFEHDPTDECSSE